MALISVIVPVYKVEKYLNRCVDSILNQTLEDFEIILVDDGSPDSCPDICDAYAEREQRIKVLHKLNGGLSDARNAGLLYVDSPFVIFIDSDDYIESDMLEYLYNNIKEHQADMSTCGVYDVYAERTEAQKETSDFVCGSQEAFKCILQGHTIRGEIWNKLIRKSCIEGMAFPKGKIYEDIFFTAELMLRVKKVAVGTKPKYYYIHREDSITGRPYRPQLFDIIEGYTKNYKIVQKYFPQLKPEAECLYIWSRFIVLDKMLEEKRYKEIEGYKELVTFIRRELFVILSNPHFNRKRKVSAVVLFFNVGLYHKLVYISCTKRKNLK